VYGAVNVGLIGPICIALLSAALTVSRNAAPSTSIDTVQSPDFTVLKPDTTLGLQNGPGDAFPSALTAASSSSTSL